MEERAFRISSPKDYAHYRFVFFATNSSVLRIQNIQLLEKLNEQIGAGPVAQP
jgi:hypothetical protein